MTKTLLPLLLCLLAAPLRAEGDDSSDKQLTRDEVATIKHKLAAVLDAVGQPGGGYAKDKDDFGLPTGYSTGDGGFWPVGSDATRRFQAGEQKQAQKSQKDFEAEYKKKMMDAQARGDFAEMSRLGQEMSQKVGGIQSQAIKTAGIPTIEVRLHLNSGVSQTVDPDSVLAEGPGMVALKTPTTSDTDDKETVRAYFDSVKLRDSKKVSAIDLSPDKTVKSKTAVVSAWVELQGPPAAVEAWAKRLDRAKILALLK